MTRARRFWRPLPDSWRDAYRRHLARTGHYLDAHLTSEDGERWEVSRWCCPTVAPVTDPADV